MDKTMKEFGDQSIIPESKEPLGKPIPVNFFKLGGTWGMVMREGQKVGSGNLDDDRLRELQEEAGIFTRVPLDRGRAEQRLANTLYQMFQATPPESEDAAKILAAQCKDPQIGNQFGEYIQGSFYPIFSGDSSHLRNPLVAPMIATLIKKAIEEPNKPILGGQGTDTADIALLSLYDVLTYDTKLPPLLLTGSNRSFNEENSDAPKNFLDLTKLAHANFGSGGFWVFHSNLYSGADFSKIDPEEYKRSGIEKQSTFYSPRETNRPIDAIVEDLKEGIRKTDWSDREEPEGNHPTRYLDADTLYKVFEEVYVDNLGNQNSSPQLMNNLYGSGMAVIVGAHSLGNVDNATRYDLVNLANEGRIVVDASRTLIGATNVDYEASLLGANNKELAGTDKKIIAAYKLSVAVARAVVVRALLERLDQEETQKLFDNYAKSRRLI